MSVGIQEIILILAAILLLFDRKRMSEAIKFFMKAKNTASKAKTLVKHEVDEILYDFKEKPVEYELKDTPKEPQI
ncbi:hypothetical protein IJ670_04465 [bacterium]|nr:hypothetical protein [bacterium]